MSVNPQTLPSLDATSLFANNGYLYAWRQSTDTHEVYDIKFNDGSSNQGLWWSDDGNDPYYHAIAVNRATNTWEDYGPSHPFAHPVENADGTVLVTDGPNGSYQNLYKFTKPTTASWISSGPNVSSITVANQNSSTRNFTVTHTGTLSASDICYTINGTDVTTLPSPNTGITNLQTTPTGSTFDSYTPSLPYGSHSINIGETFLNFFNANSTSLNDVYSSNNGITVTFPDINSGVYENNLGTVDSGVNTTVTYGADIVRIYIESANSKQITRIAIYQNWAAYVANTGSFKVLYQFWDYENLTNNSPSYTSGVFYPDPDALYETTGSPNQTLTFPTGIQVGTFEWNFATAPTTQNNPPSTSSEYNRGSNYDDRFPLITTNLFNRQRSVYAIGMTHKDTWDLFL